MSTFRPFNKITLLLRVTFLFAFAAPMLHQSTHGAYRQHARPYIGSEFSRATETALRKVRSGNALRKSAVVVAATAFSLAAGEIHPGVSLGTGIFSGIMTYIALVRDPKLSHIQLDPEDASILTFRARTGAFQVGQSVDVLKTDATPAYLVEAGNRYVIHNLRITEETAGMGYTTFKAKLKKIYRTVLD